MKWVFVNDDFVREEDASIHYTDLAFQRGYGVFDFLKVVEGRPVFLNEHIDRFYSSAAKLWLQPAVSKTELAEIIRLLITKNDVQTSGIRLTLTGGFSPDGYHPAAPNLIVSLHSFLTPGENDFTNGIRLMSYGHQRQMPEVKSIDYLMAIWLQPMLAQKKADDVLYHDSGIITECPRANFFMVSAENKLVTSSRNILKGITRSKLLALAKDSMEVEERDIHLHELRSASEAFITSTTKIILPVRQIDDYLLPAANPVAGKLRQSLVRLQTGYHHINA